VRISQRFSPIVLHNIRRLTTFGEDLNVKIRVAVQHIYHVAPSMPHMEKNDWIIFITHVAHICTASGLLFVFKIELMRF